MLPGEYCQRQKQNEDEMNELLGNDQHCEIPFHFVIITIVNIGIYFVFSRVRERRVSDPGVRVHDELPLRALSAARLRAALPPDDPPRHGVRHQAVRDVRRLARTRVSAATSAAASAIS